MSTSGFPALEHLRYIFRSGPSAKLTLGYYTAVVIQGASHALDSFIDLPGCSVGQQVLAIDFAPKGELPAEFAPQIFDIHTEKL
jgi:hypothetical protein